jgi:hypothetical protein
MTIGSGPAFPTGRTLAGWSRQLAPLRPIALRVVHATVYRVEVLTRLESPATPDPLDRLLLDAVELAPSEPGLPMFLPESVAEGLLSGLRRIGLVRRNHAGFSATEAGAIARRGERYPAPVFERRIFHLIENGPTAAAQFIPLPVNMMLPPALSPGDNLSLRPLEGAISRPDEWKRAVGFPTDVRHVYRTNEDADGPPAWLRVPVVRAETLTAALVKAEAAAGQWLGFAVRPEAGFALAGSEPILRFVELAVSMVFPEIAVPPDWPGAVRAGCTARGWPNEDVEACRVESDGLRLRVTVPSRLTGELRAITDDGWFFAGEGRSRAVAIVEIVAE